MTQPISMMESREQEKLKLLSRMELDTRESGMKLLVREMERECRSGLMVLSMRVIGVMTKLTVVED
jgi:hypothetical protein